MILHPGKPSEPTEVPSGVRARGVIRASFLRTARTTGPDHVHQGGGLRLLFPKTYDPGARARSEAVLVNTGGGVAGGDRWDLDFAAGPGAQVTVTSQSAERIYRAQREAAVAVTRIALGPDADFEWLPQETIMFDGARLERSIDVEMAADASLMMVESIVFGRTSMGEEVVSGTLRDSRRVRRDGRLVFAEELRLDGNPARILDRPASGGGARAIATILIVAPNAEARLDAVRAALGEVGDAVGHGASAWDGKLVVRLASASATALRGTVANFLTVVRGRPLPRVWPGVWP